LPQSAIVYALLVAGGLRRVSVKKSGFSSTIYRRHVSADSRSNALGMTLRFKVLPAPATAGHPEQYSSIAATRIGVEERNQTRPVFWVANVTATVAKAPALASPRMN